MAYQFFHLDPKPGADWKPTEERYLHTAIGVFYSPWPEYRMDEREAKILGEIERLARTGEVFSATSGDKYKVVPSEDAWFYHMPSEYRFWILNQEAFNILIRIGEIAHCRKCRRLLRDDMLCENHEKELQAALLEWRNSRPDPHPGKTDLVSPGTAPAEQENGGKQ